MQVPDMGNLLGGFSNMGSQINQILIILVVFGALVLICFVLYLYFIYFNLVVEIATETGGGIKRSADKGRNGIYNKKLGIMEFKTFFTRIRIPAIPNEAIYGNKVTLKKFGPNSEDYAAIVFNKVYLNNPILIKLNEKLNMMHMTIADYVQSNTENVPISIELNPFLAFDTLPQNWRAWTILKLREIDEEARHKRDMTPLLMVTGMGILMVFSIFVLIWMSKNIETYGKLAGQFGAQTAEILKENQELIKAILQLRAGGGGTPPAG